MRLLIQLLLVAACVAGTQADYNCLCAYAVETSIYTKPDTSSSVDTYMYEFDCKPVYNLATDNPNFIAVAADHKVGYVENATTVQVQVCQGSVPLEDKVTTTLPPPTTPISTTSTTKLLTTIMTASQTTTTTTAATTSPSSTLKTILTATPTIRTTTLQPFTVSTAITSTATKMVTSTTTRQPTDTVTLTSRSPTTKIPSTKMITQSTTMAPTTTSTSTTTSTRTSTPTSTTRFTRATTTTSRPTTSTKQTTTQNPIQRCPTSVISRANPKHIFTNQYYCYEFRDGYADWYDAKRDCEGHGGYLMSIENQDEQNFMYKQLQNRLRYNQPVWMGLSDEQHEGTWQWLSGRPLKYTNWMSGGFHERYKNYENCALFVTPRKGEWDDAHCRGVLLDSNARYSWICQYHLR